MTHSKTCQTTEDSLSLTSLPPSTIVSTNTETQFDFMAHQKKRAELFNKTEMPPGEYDCPVCKNRRGSMTVNSTGELIFSPCSCRSIMNSFSTMESAGISPDFLSRCNWHEWQTPISWQKKAIQIALDFVEHIKNGGESWFMMAGRPGSGKTQLCTTVFMELLKSGRSGKFVSWKTFSREAKGNTNEGIEFRKIVDPIKKTQILYIDDFWKGGVSPGDVHLAFEVINARYASRKITVISSELTLDTIMRGDEAIASRLYEMIGKYYVDTSKAENWRTRRT